MPIIRKPILTVFLVLAVGATAFEAFLAYGHRKEIERLQHVTSEARANNRYLRRERDQALRRIAGSEAAGTVPTDEGFSGDAAVDSTDKEWPEKLRRLREVASRMPGKQIPELSLLTEEDWHIAAGGLKLETTDDERRALNALRSKAKAKLAPRLQDALRDYAAANDGRLPADVSQLAPYLDPSIHDDMLQRYAMLGSGPLAEVPPYAWLIAEKIPVDDLYDTRAVVGTSGVGQAPTTPATFLTARALEAFAQANAGRKPAEASDLAPYLESPLDATTLESAFHDWQQHPGTLGLDTHFNYHPIGNPH